MLRDIALRGSDMIDDVLYTNLLIPERAEYLQAEWMGHRLERPRSTLDIGIIREQMIFEPIDALITRTHRGNLARIAHRRILLN